MTWYLVSAAGYLAAVVVVGTAARGGLRTRAALLGLTALAGLALLLPVSCGEAFDLVNPVEPEPLPSICSTPVGLEINRVGEPIAREVGLAVTVASVCLAGVAVVAGGRLRRRT